MIEPEQDLFFRDDLDDIDEGYDDDEGDEEFEDEPLGAPIFEVPQRKIVAIEHPSVIVNLDKGLATFGPEPDFQKLLIPTPEFASVPLWFRPENPTSKPLVSHHATTNNVLLKITVPKRTGRKRKRGSTEPFKDHVDTADEAIPTSDANEVSSVARRDRPRSVLRKMQDNVENYQVEAVGHVRDTHRYRGLADFQFANTSDSFLTGTAKHILPMKVSKLRDIRFDPGVKIGPNQEIIPPPHFTDRVIGFNYNYEQNPNTKVEGDEVGKPKLVNIQGRKKHSYGYFINHNQYPVPEKPRREPAMKIPDGLLSQLHALMDKRPIWTRRAILNHVTGDFTDSVMRVALQLVGYQFRGGPWRDAFIKYGLDPRPDPKFRIYQTLAFKLERNIVGKKKIPWEVVRKGQMKKPRGDNRKSHLWDGETFSTDGKFWQFCDITDPFLRKIIDNAHLRTECDVNESGWYYKGTWTKVKMIMKVKMIAMQKGRMGSDTDNPQKLGYMYNSFIEDRIRQWPDEVDRPLGLTMEPFLRRMEEVDTRIKRRRAVGPQAKKSDIAVVNPLPSTSNDPPDGSDPDAMNGNDDETPEINEEAMSPDNTWDIDVLDGDLDDIDGEVDVDEDDYEGYSDDDEEDYGEEGEDDEGEQDDEDIAMDDDPTEYAQG
ncbi:hypothetical protein F5Y04DRAFT_209826 [Hypomontagnella monticulosa]|nr:hypothetical protein F5Y04DRAFT_209826 [Hypomontagnella monticulosa]